MSGIDKVKLMDSGTALFLAADDQTARERVKNVLLQGGGSVTEEGGRLILDYSTARFWQVIEARVESTSVAGRYAASFREGNAGRLFRFDLPSKAARRRMDEVLKELTD